MNTAHFLMSEVRCHPHSVRNVDECRFRVAGGTSPHMPPWRDVDIDRAERQHELLRRALIELGAEVTLLPFVHGAHDSVFIKDPALLLARRSRKYALLARLLHPERQRERTARARCYAQQGYEVVCDDHGAPWEGGDIVMLPSGDGLFLGHGFRSRREASAWLERQVGVPVWPLELCDPHLYHLDMVLSMLPDGTALVCPDALTPDSLRLLEHVRGIHRVIRVRRESALDFSLNLVVIGRTIVLGAHDPGIEALVRTLGYRTLVVPLGQFHLAGGSAACLVAAVHRDPVEAR